MDVNIFDSKIDALLKIRTDEVTAKFAVEDAAAEALRNALSPPTHDDPIKKPRRVPKSITGADAPTSTDAPVKRTRKAKAVVA